MRRARSLVKNHLDDFRVAGLQPNTSVHRCSLATYLLVTLGESSSGTDPECHSTWGMVKATSPPINKEPGTFLQAPFPKVRGRHSQESIISPVSSPSSASQPPPLNQAQSPRKMSATPKASPSPLQAHRYRLLIKTQK